MNGEAVTSTAIRDDVVVVAEGSSWSGWDGPVVRFSDVSREDLARRRMALLVVGNDSVAACNEILQWKREELLGELKLIFATYKGRHFWSPENEQIVHRWVVHARSEREVLGSSKLVFVPLCRGQPDSLPEPGDDGYLFMGGRKWREFDLGVRAISRSGIPGLVVSDFAPEGRFPGVEIMRERVSYERYLALIARARVVLAPLKWLPISHGHTDAVVAILSGKPLIVTAGASCDDYVEHGVNGLLVRHNSVEAWVDAIHEACEKADAFAAAAREMASRYRQSQYAGYIRAIVNDPDCSLVREDPERRNRQAPRSEWGHLQQEFAIRDTKQAHRSGIDATRVLLREKRFAEALERIEPFLNGPLRASALQTALAAASHVNPKRAEVLAREILNAATDDPTARAGLAQSLRKQGRLEEARVEALAAFALDPKRVASRLCLVTILADLGEIDEASRIVAEALKEDPTSSALLRARRDLGR